jgi:hypothetical protein
MRMNKQKKGYIVDKRTDPAQVICDKCPGFTYDIVIVDEVDGKAVEPFTEFNCMDCGHTWFSMKNAALEGRAEKRYEDSRLLAADIRGKL